MSFNHKQFRGLIQETLRVLEPEIPYSEAAVELLMLTAATESNLGEYMRQIKGPARGVFQMEPATAHDLFVHWLVYQPESLLIKVQGFDSRHGNYELDWHGNIPMQIVWSRIFYRRIKEPLPDIFYLPADEAGRPPAITNQSILNLAGYWKKYYNTRLGKGTVVKAYEKYRRYCVS